MFYDLELWSQSWLCWYSYEQKVVCVERNDYIQDDTMGILFIHEHGDKHDSINKYIYMVLIIK